MRPHLFTNLMPNASMATGARAADCILSRRKPLGRRLPADVTTTPESQRRNFVRSYRAWSIGGVLLVAVSLATWFGAKRMEERTLAHNAASANLPTPVPQATIHALMGSDREPYVDHSGNTWSVANYCQGGTNVNVPQQRIEGTEDAPLYFGGIRGIAHCEPLSGYSGHV